MIAITPARFVGTGCLVLVACTAACSSVSYVQDADDEVAGILKEGFDETLGTREADVIHPEIEPPKPEPPPTQSPLDTPPAVPDAPKPSMKLDLADSLATAVKLNREFISQRESLYQQGLSLSLTRFGFGPQFNQAVTYVWGHDEDGIGQQRAGTTVGASQILPTGGTIGLNAGVDAALPYGNPAFDDPSYSTSAGVTLSQPLLRGAGHDIAWEPLTQAERNLVYSIRSFENFREGFSIQIAQQYFALLAQKKQLANQDQDYANAVFDRRKAEALLQVGRNTDEQVFLARRSEITAKDALISARTSYDRAVDSYKIQLGLPTQTVIELVDADPPYEPVHYEVSSAIRAALNNRLDLVSQRQQLEDNERSLNIAENGLLPALDLSASFGASGSGNDLGHAPPDEWNSSVGLTFEVPWQQKGSRNSYRSALISFERGKRDLQLREDQVELDIRDAIRSLRSIEERIELQKDNIAKEQRAVTITEIKYEAGNVDNRDLLDARRALTTAQNELISLQVQHFIGRLNLLKDMGVFFVDDKGMWR